MVISGLGLRIDARTTSLTFDFTSARCWETVVCICDYSAFSVFSIAASPSTALPVQDPNFFLLPDGTLCGSLYHLPHRRLAVTDGKLASFGPYVNIDYMLPVFRLGVYNLGTMGRSMGHFV